MDKYNIEVGKRIQKARTNAGMTKRELASKMSMHESTIKRYEDGQIKQLDIEKITEFANKLGVAPDYLMCWSDDISYITEDHHLIPKKDHSEINTNNMLLAYYNALSKNNQELTLNLVEQLYKKEKGQ